MAVTALAFLSAAIWILAHLAGLVVSVILLVRKKGTPAILATVAFALLFLRDIGSLLQGVVAAPLARAFGGAPTETATWVYSGLGCCCGIFDVAAIVCLIIALWQAISGRAASPVAGEPLVEVVTPQ